MCSDRDRDRAALFLEDFLRPQTRICPISTTRPPKAVGRRLEPHIRAVMVANGEGSAASADAVAKGNGLIKSH